MGTAYQCDWCTTLFSEYRGRPSVRIVLREDVTLVLSVSWRIEYSTDGEVHHRDGSPDICIACVTKALEALQQPKGGSDAQAQS